MTVVWAIMFSYNYSSLINADIYNMKTYTRVHCVCLNLHLNYFCMYLYVHTSCMCMKECKTVNFCVFVASLFTHTAYLTIWCCLTLTCSRWQAGMMGMVISQVDLGTPWGMSSVCLSQDITRLHILLHTHHKPMKMITFDTQMTFYPCCDNTGSFFCSDIRCCVGVIQVKSIILMEK